MVSIQGVPERELSVILKTREGGGKSCGNGFSVAAPLTTSEEGR